MRELLYLVFLFVSIAPILAQAGPTIRVLGKYDYEVSSSAWTMTFAYQQSAVEVDTIGESLSIKQRVARYEEGLATVGLDDYKVTKLDFPRANTSSLLGYPTNGSDPYELFEFSTSDPDVCFELRRLAKEFNEVGKMFFYYNNVNFDEEDPRAVAAFIDAENRAKAIAKAEGFSSVRLLSIDDDTTPIKSCEYCFDFSGTVKTSAREAYKSELVAIISKTQREADGSRFSQFSSFKAHYQLWVEFEAVP